LKNGTSDKTKTLIKREGKRKTITKSVEPPMDKPSGEFGIFLAKGGEQ